MFLLYVPEYFQCPSTAFLWVNRTIRFTFREILATTKANTQLCSFANSINNVYFYQQQISPQRYKIC